MTTLDSIRTLLAEIDEDENDYDLASTAWATWQDRAEELASLVNALLANPTGVEYGVVVNLHPSTQHRGVNIEVDAPEGMPLTVHVNDGRIFREVVGSDDGDFDSTLSRVGLPADALCFQIEQGSHGTADWRETPDGIPTEARLAETFTRLIDADDWALGQLHTGAADEVWAVTHGSEFRLYTWDC